MQTCPDQSRQIQASSDKSIHVHTCLVRHGLKYELYITWRAGQRYSAERAGRLETGSATRNRYFRPIFHRFGRSHVTTGDKAISRSITVYIKSWKKEKRIVFKKFMMIQCTFLFFPCPFTAPKLFWTRSNCISPVQIVLDNFSLLNFTFGTMFWSFQKNLDR